MNRSTTRWTASSSRPSSKAPRTRRTPTSVGPGPGWRTAGPPPASPNPAGPDGTTLLDAVWSAAPFKNKNALVRHVRATVDS
ncbi:hypothetical protein [Streptomyces sp. NPDC003032]